MDGKRLSKRHGATAVEAGIGRSELFHYLAYYSFVTISTLGYGDIIPVHRVAQNWAAVEAMIGQFYIAIVIARLVGMYSAGQVQRPLPALVGWPAREPTCCPPHRRGRPLAGRRERAAVWRLQLVPADWKRLTLRGARRSA